MLGRVADDIKAQAVQDSVGTTPTTTSEPPLATKVPEKEENAAPEKTPTGITHKIGEAAKNTAHKVEEVAHEVAKETRAVLGATKEASKEVVTAVRGPAATTTAATGPEATAAAAGGSVAKQAKVEAAAPPRIGCAPVKLFKRFSDTFKSAFRRRMDEGAVPPPGSSAAA